MSSDVHRRDTKFATLRMAVWCAQRAPLSSLQGLPFGEGGGPACHNSIADPKIFLSLVRLRE